MDQLTAKVTADGSLTFFSEDYQECFHSRHGAKQESIYQYVVPAKLLARAQTQSEIHILDVCYGLGYNSAAAIEFLYNSPTRLVIHALEIDAQVPQQAIDRGIMTVWSETTQQILKEIARNYTFTDRKVSVFLHIGDARQTIKTIPLQWADAIFFDPFSPPKCPQLWTVEFIKLVADRLHFDGCLLTYSCAAAIRKAMLAADLIVGSTPPLGRVAPGTIAAFNSRWVPPLTIAEQEHLRTKAAVPYRDPNLCDSATTILDRRSKEQAESSLEPTSQWKRRHNP
ncbi:MAG: hypothetical protein CV045_10935 [Cyanobacteria bacterium M5B4]|nr:MAG: hypothetical protein CV045_10935 [Cyanobacteria bacterium M5B4]